MASTTYTDFNAPAVNAAWLNDVNTATYTTVPAHTTSITNIVSGAQVVGASTNIAAGTAGSLPYQTAAGTTAMLAAGTAGQVQYTSGTAPAYATLNPSDNPIINGEMLVDQVNAGAAITVAITTPTYLVDMFYGFTAGATVQAQQVAGAGEFQKALQFTGAASVTGITCGHRIESKNAARFTNQTVNCNLRMSNSLLTAVTWNAYYANVADTFSAKTLIATGALTINATDTDYSFSFAAGANAGNGIAIEFVVGAQTSGTWKLTGLDMFTGAIARSYPHLTYGQELARCQRYLKYTGGTGVVGDVYLSGYAGGAAGQATSLIQYPVEMRVAPTLTKNGTWTVINCGQPTAIQSSKYGFTLLIAATVAGALSTSTANAACSVLSDARL